MSFEKFKNFLTSRPLDDTISLTEPLGGTMVRLFIGIIFGVLLLFLFFYFGGPTYLETFGKKAEETGKNLKHYEQATRDTAKKVGEKYDDIKKRLEQKSE